MHKKDTKNDIIVSFLGESRSDVTGSSVLINIPTKSGERYNILLEMGLVQGASSIEKDLANNRKMLERYSKELAESIRSVFVMHPHIDHTGNLPRLAALGFNGSVIMPKDTVDITKHLIKNSVEIHLSSVQKIKNLKGKHLEPFYNLNDMDNLFLGFDGREPGVRHRLTEEVEYEFINNNHTIGSCMLKLYIRKPNNSMKKLVYTSDIGSTHSNSCHRFVNDRDTIGKCDCIITEATYNTNERGFSKKDAKKELDSLRKSIKRFLDEGKTIIMPAFSFGRTQTLMSVLYDTYKDIDFKYDIFIDGKLTHEINSDYEQVLRGEDAEYFKDMMKWNNFKLNKEYDGTKLILADKKPKIVIASSGFMTAGRIVSYLEKFIPSNSAVIMLTGFCGDIGKRLLSDQKTITIDNKKLTKNADIVQLKTFSSHIQYNELISLLKGVRCERILVHHSSSDNRNSFCDNLRLELRDSGSAAKVIAVSDKNNQFTL